MCIPGFYAISVIRIRSENVGGKCVSGLTGISTPNSHVVEPVIDSDAIAVCIRNWIPGKSRGGIGIQIDPGFRGRLAISLFHSGPEPIKLKHKLRMFTVEFHLLDHEASKGYKGPFQNQTDFHKMQKDFILNANTTSLAEINTLPDEMASLERRFALHETVYHPRREHPSVTELAEAQGVKPLEDFEELARTWPEDESVDDFLEAVQQIIVKYDFLLKQGFNRLNGRGFHVLFPSFVYRSFCR